MFEAKLTEGHVLKKIIESIKDLVQDVNIDVSPSGKFQTSFYIHFISFWFLHNFIPDLNFLANKPAKQKIDFCIKIT